MSRTVRCVSDGVNRLGQPRTEIDVRESMRRLPRGIQWLLTIITGKPLRGQRPLWRRTPLWHLVTALVALLGGTAASGLILTVPLAWWPLLVISWVSTVHGARKLQVMVLHHAVHHTAFGERWDRIIMEVVSTLLLIQGYDGFEHNHVGLHHKLKYLATVHDPDVCFLLELGFRPGMRREELWRHLVKSLGSPWFHGRFLRARLTANFLMAPLYRRGMAVAYAAAVLTAVALTHAWVAFALAWVVPVMGLYHISALLHLIGEHRWLRVRDPRQPHKLVLARLTSGRFMGEPVPPASLPLPSRLAAWGRWILKMGVFHIPARAAVTVGDLPQHDYHHRHPRRNDWANAVYARQQDLEAGCPGWPEPYTEVWGLFNALDEVFELWSTLPPLTEPMPPLPRAVVNEQFGAM